MTKWPEFMGFGRCVIGIFLVSAPQWTLDFWKLSLTVSIALCFSVLSCNTKTCLFTLFDNIVGAFKCIKLLHVPAGKFQLSQCESVLNREQIPARAFSVHVSIEYFFQYLSFKSPCPGEFSIENRNPFCEKLKTKYRNSFCELRFSANATSINWTKCNLFSTVFKLARTKGSWSSKEGVFVLYRNISLWKGQPQETTPIFKLGWLF